MAVESVAKAMGNRKKEINFFTFEKGYNIT